MANEEKSLSLMTNNKFQKLIRTVIERRMIKKEEKELHRIIDTLSTLDEFAEALTVDAFKVLVNQSLQKNRKGLFIMGDGNNIRQYNEKMGMQKVDECLKDSVLDIYNILKKNKIDVNNKIGTREENTACVGKMGDEFYIYVPGEYTQEQKENIVKQLNDNKSIIPITYAMGDLTNGLASAMEQADEAITQKKSEHNMQLFMNQQQDNAEETIQYYVDNVIKVLRLVGNETTNEDIEKINENMKIAISKVINMQGNQERKIVKENNIDVVKNRMEQLQENVKMKYSNIQISKEFVNKYVLAKMLSEKPIETTTILTKDKADKIDLPKKFMGRNAKQTMQNISKYSIIQIEIGKIKKYNEEYGHNACDKAVYQSMGEIDSIIKDIIPVKEVVAKGISTLYYYVSKDTSKEETKKLQEALDEYEKTNPFIFSCSEPKRLVENKEEFLKKYKDMKSSEIIQKLMTDARAETEIQVRKISAKKKKEDVNAMQEVFRSGFEKLAKDRVIRGYVKMHMDKENETETMKKMLYLAVERGTKKKWTKQKVENTKTVEKKMEIEEQAEK